MACVRCQREVTGLRSWPRSLVARSFNGGAERFGLDWIVLLDAASPLILLARFQHDARMTAPVPG